MNIMFLRIIFAIIASIIGFAFFGGGIIGFIVAAISFFAILFGKLSDD